MKTRERLASELRKIAAQASPANAAKYEAFAVRAATGEFDDYADTYVCPITQLHSELTAAGFTKFAARVAAGEFDATKEESDATATTTEVDFANWYIKNGCTGMSVMQIAQAILRDFAVHQRKQQ